MWSETGTWESSRGQTRLLTGSTQRAFVQNAVGTFGQLRPDSLTNPGYVNFDINLQKNFIFRERYNRNPEFFLQRVQSCESAWAWKHPYFF